jgi:hypothetical protein
VRQDDASGMSCAPEAPILCRKTIKVLSDKALAFGL